MPTVSLSPAGSAWAELARSHASRTLSNKQSLLFRRELGLTPGTPVVMSGHQAQWWHAGILAKQIALAAVCRKIGAAAAWVVVDQDASDSLSPGYPAKNTAGTLPTRATWALAPDELAAQSRADVALADLPPFAPAAPPTDSATPDVARGLRAIADSAARWSTAPNAAEQIARANAELTGTILDTQPTLVFATAILRTTAGRALLESMAENPERCVAAYNKAVSASGVSTIAPLSLSPEKSRFELPLWQLSGKGNKPTPRRRVFAHTLGEVPLDSIAPRGVLMTALLRWLGCDLFIHGTGGGASGEAGGYDKVAEHWMRLWLGVDLAPSVVATATALLPMGNAPVISERDVYDAHRRIENARHAPRTLGDAHAQKAKDELVAAIASTTDRAERARLYRQLQQHLDRYRAAHAGELRASSESASAAASELQRQAVLRDRTWPWPVLPRPVLMDLRRTLERAMDA